MIPEIIQIKMRFGITWPALWEQRVIWFSYKIDDRVTCYWHMIIKKQWWVSWVRKWWAVCSVRCSLQSSVWIIQRYGTTPTPHIPTYSTDSKVSILILFMALSTLTNTILTLLILLVSSSSSSYSHSSSSSSTADLSITFDTRLID